MSSSTACQGMATAATGSCSAGLPTAAVLHYWLLQVGKKNRVVGATLMNQDSSRSHSIFTITIEATERFNQADAGGHYLAMMQPRRFCLNSYDAFNAAWPAKDATAQPS